MDISIGLKKELKTFLEKKLREEKKVAYIISSYPLAQEEIDKIKERLPFLKDKKVVNQVSKNILAGFIVKIGTKIYDFSLNSKLKSLKSILYENDR